MKDKTRRPAEEGEGKARQLGFVVQQEAQRILSEAQLQPDPVLVAAGWERRFTADGRRAQEMVELYTELGYDVHLEPVKAEEFGDECEQCTLLALLEFATIYLGPTLVFIGWWFLLRKLVRIGHVHRITSLQTLVRIIDDGPTFETLNLAGTLAASCPDVVDEPSVSARRIRDDFFGSPSRLLNCLRVHRFLRVVD